MSWDWKFPEYCNGDKEAWKRLSDKCKERDNNTCTVCKRSKDNTPGLVLHAAHIVSKRQGGQDCLSNLTTKCDHCHRKTDKHSWLKAKSGKPKGKRRSYL